MKLIGRSTVSVTLKYLLFELITYEILDFGGRNYEQIDYFS